MNSIKAAGRPLWYHFNGQRNPPEGKAWVFSVVDPRKGLKPLRMVLSMHWASLKGLGGFLRVRAAGRNHLLRMWHKLSNRLELELHYECPVAEVSGHEVKAKADLIGRGIHVASERMMRLRLSFDDEKDCRWQLSPEQFLVLRRMFYALDGVDTAPAVQVVEPVSQPSVSYQSLGIYNGKRHVRRNLDLVASKSE